MGTMRPEMTELECCPQCAGRLVEALEAAGVRAGSDCIPGAGCADECDDREGRAGA